MQKSKQGKKTKAFHKRKLSYELIVKNTLNVRNTQYQSSTNKVFIALTIDSHNKSLLLTFNKGYLKKKQLNKN